MINKELLKKILKFKGDNNEEFLNESDYTPFKIKFEDNQIEITLDNIDDGFIIKHNLYELGVDAKEYLEYYAKSLHLSAVWIDLNEISKDILFYFGHCYEVYEQLAQYDLIMESEEL